MNRIINEVKENYQDNDIAYGNINKFERNKIVSKEENTKLMHDIYNEFVYEDKKIENF